MTDRFSVAHEVFAATGGGRTGLPERLCGAICRGMAADEAVITLLAPTGHRQLLCASGATARRLEELEFTLGEGPGIAAARSGDPEVIGDLHGETTPWALFGAIAREELPEIGAIHAYPLRFRGEAFGSVGLLWHRPAEADDAETAERGCIAARAAAMALRPLRDSLLHDLHAPDWDPVEVVEAYWGTTHLAADALAERLGSSTDEALAQMRAHAFRTGRGLPDIAAEVFARPRSWPPN